MSLFQSSVLHKYLNNQDEAVVKHLYNAFTKYFHNPTIQQNIRESKEEQFQEGFLTELFVKVLGYTINPNPEYNLTTEFKNQSGAKKADGAILKDGNAIGVIELKSTKTKDLEEVRQQAFDYKANQANCVYVVTSNFEKLRFYIHNAVDFEEFDLFRLTYDRFRILFLCLANEQILKDIPQKIKEESVVKDEQITKQLYSDYSVFKRELFDDLVKQNMDNPLFEGLDVKEIKKTLFQKSQKLLDRFLFIFFAEDRGLLPPNSITTVLDHWKKLQELDEYKPLYDRYKKYFGYLNTGLKGKEHDIYAYNGGLFKPDELLDSLLIDDDLLYRHTARLTAYDFETEVDVNILGHIFENSLNEIESVNAEIEGVAFEKQTSKRKKDGVFYTPKYITKYIVDNTVGRLCREKKEELGIVEEEYLKSRKGRQERTLRKLDDKLKAYRDWLLKITICDPACGSGAFLNQALNFLIEEHHYIDQLESALLDHNLVFRDVENSILENNLYGVDLNDESVEIARLSLWLRTAQKGRKLTTLSDNIKCGNSLIDDPEVAGNKAFNWQQEFPDVMENEGFDVVIGNPPYVRAELLGEYRGYFQKHFNVFDSASDLFAYFYELGSRLINEKGIFSYISNTFDKTTAGRVLREYLSKNITLNKYIDFTEVQIFEGATTYPVIITLTKQKPEVSNEFTYIKIPKKSQSSIIDIDLHQAINVNQNSLESSSWSFLSTGCFEILARIKTLPTLRQKYGKCYYGVKTALNDAFIVPKKYPLSDHIKAIYEGKEIKKWNTAPAEQQLILFESKWTSTTYGENLSEKEAYEKVKSDYPDIISHLLSFEENAKKRYDKGEFWWELRNCAYYELFDKPKIIFPNLQNQNKFCLDLNGVYVNAPAVFLPSSNKTLLCILNSKLVWEFLKSICVVRSGGYIEVKPQYFEQIPIPELKNDSQFEKKADIIIDATAELQKIQSTFTSLLTSKFQLAKISKKIQSWDDLEFGEFLVELKKAKVLLNLSEEAEWMSYFNEQKQKAQELKSEINRIDREIDQMVYELYGLTEEEIRIVEGKQ